MKCGYGLCCGGVCERCRMDIAEKERKSMTNPDANVRGGETGGPLGDELDCGDNSCYFAPKSGGMRTNGGCRCFKNAGFPRSPTAAAFKLLPALRAALKERDALRAQLEVARDGLNSAVDWLGKHQKPLSLNEVKQCFDHEKRCKEALAKLEEK